MKTIRILYIAVAVVVLAVSCTKGGHESVENGGNTGNGQEEVLFVVPDRLSVSLEQVDTRAFLDDEMNILWHSEDAISYFTDIYSNIRYDFTGTSEGGHSLFAKADEGSQGSAAFDRNFAVYPYDDANSVSTEGVVSCTFASTQTYIENSFGPEANVMLAVTHDEDDHSIAFRNCCGYLMLQLYGTGITVQSVVVRGNGYESLAGKSEIHADEAGIPYVAVTDGAVSELVLDCGDGVLLSDVRTAPISFWFVIPPVEFDGGVTVVVTDDTGREFMKSISDAVTIERNTVCPVPAFEIVYGEIMTFEDIRGVWKLDKWQGETPTFSVYMEIREDGTVVLWQRLGDYSWDRYESTAMLDSKGIRGTYSDGAAWAASYRIELEGDEMVWTDTEDDNDVSVYVKSTLPDGLMTTRSCGTIKFNGPVIPESVQRGSLCLPFL